MNIYIDCGFYRGIALIDLINNKTVDDSWDVYAFEPNADLRMKEAIQHFPVPIKLIEKAVWTKNTKIPFIISTRDNASTAAWILPQIETIKTIEVPAINFSLFLKKLPDDAYIYCSMDIEGAEYEVLEKLFKDGTIKKINVLDIEFHHRMIPKYSQEDSQALIDRLEAENIKVTLKVPLN